VERLHQQAEQREVVGHDLMPAFRYDPFVNPYAPSIGELIAHQHDAQVHAADLIGAANARASERTGAAWAGAAQGIGNAVAGTIQQATDPQRQLETVQLQDLKDRRNGQAVVDALMRRGQTAPGEVGPQQESYLTPEGLFDVPKLNQALSAQGHAHNAPELLKGAEGINDSILKHQQLEQQAASQHTLLLGDLADGALKLAKLGMPLDKAMDFVVQPALATKRIQPQEYAQVREQIAALPPEQQAQVLTTFMDAASKLDKGETLAEGAIRADRYGRTVATGAKKPPTAAELAFDLSSPDPEVRARAKTAIEALHPPARRSDTDLALDAYAKSIGKSKAEDLTYAERQTFEKNKATITSDQAFQQHIRERQYDIAHPTPEKAKSQDALEQEYRTVLARGLSSRSGGLGLEDSKVQQANHLLALLDQTYDPKTGEYTIPKVLQGELAAGLARLVAPGGNVGIEMMREFDQRTAKGDVAGAFTYLTGTPFPTATQDIAKMLKDSIERQGKVALENREGEMRYLRGLAPTDLAEDRRTKLEGTSLNPLRQSRVIQNTQTGERRMQVSTDGGVTWK
jgi:hypothetical protein